MDRRTEWVMHVWGKKRDKLELTDVEKFHIDMLKMFQDQQKQFDRIIVNIAMDDINDLKLYEFLKCNILKVIKNKNVAILACQNEKDKGEYVTFRPYVFDRIGKDVNVFYSHFKGYNTFFKVMKESYPTRISNLCEKFWSYIMYRYSLQDLKDVDEKLKDHSTYCWYVLKNDVDDVNIGFYNEYHQYIQDGNDTLKGYVEDNYHKHSPGGFMWYNLKRLDEVLESKPEVKNITTEYIQEHSDNCKVGLFTHFSELFLMNYLKDEECYSLNDYNKEFHEMIGTPYTGIYPSKKIAREFIPDFEKYLIDNGLI